MPRRRIPSYSCYKPKNLGLVVLDGKQHYLGRYGTPESVAEYNRLVQEWLTRGSTTEPQVPSSPKPDAGSQASPDSPLVNELIVAYLKHAEAHYVRPDGTPSGEPDIIRSALKPLRRLYGYTPALDFGPMALRAVRDQMIDQGLSRTTINARVDRIRRLFRWAEGGFFIGQPHQDPLPVGLDRLPRTIAILRRWAGRASPGRGPPPPGRPARGGRGRRQAPKFLVERPWMNSA